MRNAIKAASACEMSKKALLFKKFLLLVRLESDSFLLKILRFRAGCSIAMYRENALYDKNLLQKVLNACLPD